MKKQYKKVLHRHNQLEIEIASLEKMINLESDFPVVIDFHPRDGYVVSRDDDNFPVGMPVADVLEVIERDGRLTEDNFFPIS